MPDKRYRALRSFFYTTTEGVEVLAQEGDAVQDASAAKIADLLADGLIQEARASSKES